MAKPIIIDTEATPEPTLDNISVAQLIEILKAQGISTGQAFAAAINENAPKKKVSYGEYMRRPEQIASQKTLKRVTYQNGFVVNPSGLSDATIDKLAELETGKYMSGVVDVLAKDNGGPIYLRYKNSSPDDRMTLASNFSSFSDLVQKLHAEMKSRIVK